MANSNDDLLDLNLDNDFYNILNPESNNEEISNNWTNYYSLEKVKFNLILFQ